jgi:hypothetical protein
VEGWLTCDTVLLALQLGPLRLTGDQITKIKATLNQRHSTPVAEGQAASMRMTSASSPSRDFPAPAGNPSA